MMEVILKDISKISAGNSAPKKDEFSNEGTPFVRAGSLAFLTNGKSLDLCEKVSDVIAFKKRLKLFKKGSILFAKSGMSSKMGRIYQLEQDAYIVSHLAIIDVNDSIANPSYIKYFFILRPPFFLIRDDAYPSIKLEDIKNITLNLPDLPTQNKIVTLLDKASALVQKREESIALLEELLRAQFLEMFGDPVLNPKGWEMIKLRELGDWKSGGTPSKSKKEYFEGNIPWLSSGELNNIYIENTKEHITQEAINNSNTKLIKEGSLLLGMYDTAALKSSINTKTLCCNQAISYSKINSEKAVTEFVYFNIQYNKDYLKSKQRGVRQQNLNLTMVKNIEIFDVPLVEQNKFKKLLDTVLAQKETLIQSKTALENLYHSLLQRAFSGQLNFNVDIELNALLAAIDIEQNTEKEKHNIKEIATVYAGRLLERIEEQKFDTPTQYQQAKQVVFQMLEEGVVKQTYDEKEKAVKLKLV